MASLQKTSKTINIILWVVQIVLSFTLLWSAYLKLLQPADKLAAMWPWTADNRGLVMLTGILDLLAAFGLILPLLLRIKPELTMYAAAGLVLLMIGAIIFHLSRGEGSVIGINVATALLAAFVAWGRR